MPASFADSSSSCSGSVVDLAAAGDGAGGGVGVGGVEGRAGGAGSGGGGGSGLGGHGGGGHGGGGGSATSAAPHEKPLTLDELCRLTHFSRQEVRAFYRTLKQECPRGVINEETLRDVYNRLFPEGNGTLYARHVFRALDIHGSGGVTFTQLLVFLSTICKGTTQDRLRWIFRLYDMDGDGVLQVSELFALIWAIREMAGDMSSETPFFEVPKKRTKDGRDEAAEERERERCRVRVHAEELFQRWDLNHDGLVTWDEFLTSCLRDDTLADTFNYFIA